MYHISNDVTFVDSWMLISWRRVNDFPQIDNTRNFTVKIIYYSNVFKYSNIRTFEFWSMYTVYIIYSIIRVNDMGRRFSSNCSNWFWKWKKNMYQLCIVKIATNFHSLQMVLFYSESSNLKNVELFTMCHGYVLYRKRDSL